MVEEKKSNKETDRRGMLGGAHLAAHVSACILDLIIEYCREHSRSVPDPDDYHRYELDNHGELDVFDAEFAANYLSIQGLLDLTCRTVADMMRRKSPREIGKMFHIQNDYTPEEEEEVRMENSWAFD